MANTINSGVAALRTLESWGVDHIYGIPGGTINNLMYALDEEKDKITYVHVRHEEVGALAAVADTKLTGKSGLHLDLPDLVQRICSKALMMQWLIKCRCY